jgi:hypothetical protein
LPSATLGKEHTAKKLSAKRPLPSVFYRAFGKGFAEYHSAKAEPKKSEKNWKFFLIF